MSEPRQLHLFKSRRQRGLRPPAATEWAVHCMVADTLRRWASPNWIFTHFPAGEKRDAMTGARLKRMAVQPGIADFLFLPPAGATQPRTHFLELKRRGGKLSPAQCEFALWCRLNGYPFEVADSYEAAIAILKRWGVLRTGVHVQ
jgi:hypothetical protein